MTLHLIKLCVGVDTFDELRTWQQKRLRQMRKAGEPAELKHTTRMMPKRRDELLAGGSLYWVIKGLVQARQTLTDIRPFTDSEGISRCHLMLGDKLVPVAPRPFRAFQGWRYYQAKDAPPDLATGDEINEMPEEMRRELAELGLL